MDADSSPLRPLLRPLAILFAVSLVIAIALPQLRFLRPITPGSYFPAFFSGLALVTVAIWNLMTEASVGAMLDGRAMVHWVIEGERWQAFARRKRAQGKRKLLLFLLLSPLFLFPFVLLWDEVETSFSVWLIGSIAGVLVLGYYYATRTGQGAFATSTTQGEVLLLESHAVVAGVLYRWGGFHRRVTAVEMDAPLGLFRVRVHVSTGSGRTSSNPEYEIPFPEDAEDEARRIVDAMTAQFGDNSNTGLFLRHRMDDPLAAFFPLSPRRTLQSRLREQIGEVLVRLGIGEAAFAAEMEAMQTSVLAKTASRQVVGVLVDFAHMAQSWPDLVTVPTAMSLYVSRTPCGALEMVFPDEATVRAFCGPRN